MRQDPPVGTGVGAFPDSSGPTPGYGGGSAAYGSMGYGGFGAGPGVGQQQLSRPANFHSRSLSLLIVLPAAIFVVIAICYCFAYQQHPEVVWVLSVLILCLSFVFMMARHKEGAPRFWANVGMLLVLATLAGNAAGQWNFYRNFFLYYAYEGQPTYSKVAPTQSAAIHLDAGVVEFTPQARVDGASAVGLDVGKDRICVAPIVDSSEKPATVEYWAAGINCCGDEEHSRAFSCDDVDDPQAHAGLVWLSYGPQKHLLSDFRKAANMAQNKTSPPSQGAIFVRWVVDPSQAQYRYWRAGASFMVAESIVYLVFSAIVGAWLHFGGGGSRPQMLAANAAQKWV
mmetsp:Transcript_63175/g.133345  ORF Transcript_63175/g.133345 Transcript_63175/m.133345 type:complete len:341 (+) Transcript_63175:174-1196(+)